MSSCMLTQDMNKYIRTSSAILNYQPIAAMSSYQTVAGISSCMLAQDMNRYMSTSSTILNYQPIAAITS